MIQIKTTILSKIVKSKKDFLLYDINENGILTNYILTNDFKRKKEFHVVHSLYKVASLYEVEYFNTIKQARKYLYYGAK